MHDERLAAAVGGGDHEAFELLFRRHQPAVLGFCRHMLGRADDAQDAAQHTFMAAYRAMCDGQAPHALRPWLFTVARNRCVSMLRARREASVSDREVEPVGEGLAVHVQHRADLRALLRDLSDLPDDQRAALLLAELGDLPHQDIALVIGVRREKVKALVFQARKSLLAAKDARDTPCWTVQRELATAHGSGLRRAHLRRHLHSCSRCRDFRDGLREQRRALALLLPVLPMLLRDSGLTSAAGAGIGVAGPAGSGAGTTAAAGTAASTAATAAPSGAHLGALTLFKTATAKLAAGAIVAGGAVGGAAVVDAPISRGGEVAPQPAQVVAADAPAGAVRAPETPLLAGAGTPESLVFAPVPAGAAPAPGAEQRAPASEGRRGASERGGPRESAPADGAQGALDPGGAAGNDDAPAEARHTPTPGGRRGDEPRHTEGKADAPSQRQARGRPDEPRGRAPSRGRGNREQASVTPRGTGKRTGSGKPTTTGKPIETGKPAETGRPAETGKPAAPPASPRSTSGPDTAHKPKPPAPAAVAPAGDVAAGDTSEPTAALPPTDASGPAVTGPAKARAPVVPTVGKRSTDK